MLRCILVSASWEWSFENFCPADRTLRIENYIKSLAGISISMDNHYERELLFLLGLLLLLLLTALAATRHCCHGSHFAAPIPLYLYSNVYVCEHTDADIWMLGRTHTCFWILCIFHTFVQNLIVLRLGVNTCRWHLHKVAQRSVWVIFIHALPLSALMVFVRVRQRVSVCVWAGAFSICQA